MRKYQEFDWFHKALDWAEAFLYGAITSAVVTISLLFLAALTIRAYDLIGVWGVAIVALAGGIPAIYATWKVIKET